MKNIPYYIAIGILAAASASCGKESVSQVSTFPEDSVVRINAMVTSTRSGTGTLATRADAVASTEYSGKDLGFFLDYKYGPYTRSNVRWEKDPDKGWQPESQILWQDARSKADIYAYAPYLSGATDTTKVGFSIPANQLDGIDVADFLWFAHKQFDPNADLSSNKAIDITFSHALVKLTVSITKGDQFDGTGISIKEVRLNDTTSDVECNITNGKVSAVAGSTMVDISMHSAGTADGKDNYDAIFWPGAGQKSGAKMVTVTMSDGKKYNLTLGQDLTLQGGHAYTMTVKVGKDRIEAGTVVVIDWNETPVDINGGREFVAGEIAASFGITEMRESLEG